MAFFKVIQFCKVHIFLLNLFRGKTFCSDETKYDISFFKILFSTEKFTRTERKLFF